ncbi:cupredoxin domain-containing protein [Candidatus Nitrosocosmicus franklandus]|uniref:Alternative cytochrome c oxidase subunit 2 n=1 Tax=Candidatus Nitrosocosmicus franklandianus TaxID=1798806 RepID=A0A484I9Z3_9ARCH|nr:cupredoxin domain-containing protein [Candidatus Nitrosocosmicus franklandus]VFJ14552.1 Alternative cytochrome c oxidase subunit 2 [Candidatus Nitrosocosmicus franklandus]
MGHATPEWIYIGVVTALLIWVGAEAWNIEHALEYAPPNSETVRVVGQQWFWSFQHADGTQEINELHVKEGVPYRFEIVSSDVVHSFNIPDFAILMDAVPGRVNTVWNTFDEPGEYLIECREYCGMLHQDMRARLFVEPNTENTTSTASTSESGPTISQGTGTATIVAPGGSEVGSTGTGTMRVVEPGDLTTSSAGTEEEGAATTGGDNASSNATSGSGSGNETATGASSVTLSIPTGAATPGNPSYSPDTLTASQGEIITVSNDDTAPHTVTSGASPGDADAGQLFDTSIIMPAGTADIDTSNVEAGEHPFHCTVHPFMTGTLTVQ